MLSELTASQIAEWEAFSELEPFGSLRDDLRAGMVGAVITNNIPFRGRGARAVRPADLFPSLRPSPTGRGQTREQIQAVLVHLTHAMGGRVVRAADLRREQEAKRAKKG
ncbi:MAG TPA: hypothetical protein VKE74_20230 [Gemmataceae bacterium]|nr:hypothetical protein [Gemmataceae bacterium]